MLGKVEDFSPWADQWWDPEGPMSMLHKMNGVRVGPS